MEGKGREEKTKGRRTCLNTLRTLTPSPIMHCTSVEVQSLTESGPPQQNHYIITTGHPITHYNSDMKGKGREGKGTNMSQRLPHSLTHTHTLSLSLPLSLSPKRPRSFTEPPHHQPDNMTERTDRKGPSQIQSEHQTRLTSKIDSCLSNIADDRWQMKDMVLVHTRHRHTPTHPLGQRAEQQNWI
jgi:hypothetical protein